RSPPPAWSPPIAFPCLEVRRRSRNALLYRQPPTREISSATRAPYTSLRTRQSVWSNSSRFDRIHKRYVVVSGNRSSACLPTSVLIHLLVRSKNSGESDADHFPLPAF